MIEPEMITKYCQLGGALLGGGISGALAIGAAVVMVIILI